MGIDGERWSLHACPSLSALPRSHAATPSTCTLLKSHQLYKSRSNRVVRSTDYVRDRSLAAGTAFLSPKSTSSDRLRPVGVGDGAVRSTSMGMDGQYGVLYRLHGVTVFTTFPSSRRADAHSVHGTVTTTSAFNNSSERAIPFNGTVLLSDRA